MEIRIRNNVSGEIAVTVRIAYRAVVKAGETVYIDENEIAWIEVEMH